MVDFTNGGDPTRPLAPAFTTLSPQVDIMERQRLRKSKGGIMPPMMFAKLEDAVKNNPRRNRNARPA